MAASEADDTADLAEIEAIRERGPVWVDFEEAQQMMNDWLAEGEES